MRKLKKKEIILVIIFFISITVFNVKEFSFNMNKKLLIEEVSENESNDVEDEKERSSVEASEDMTEPNEIEVDICGAVNNPKVVTLKEGDRVIDAINSAGGLTDKADINRINRAKYVYDGEKIIIPEVGQDIDSEGIMSSDTLGIDKKININTASKEELMKLSGIGESISVKIIKYRQANNGFKSVEDIMNVSGIGESKFEQIKDSIKVK